MVYLIWQIHLKIYNINKRLKIKICKIYFHQLPTLAYLCPLLTNIFNLLFFFGQNLSHLKIRLRVLYFFVYFIMFAPLYYVLILLHLCVSICLNGSKILSKILGWNVMNMCN